MLYVDMDEVLHDLEGSMEKMFPGKIFRSDHPDCLDAKTWVEHLYQFVDQSGFQYGDVLPSAKWLQWQCQKYFYMGSVTVAILTAADDYDRGSAVQQKLDWLKHEAGLSFLASRPFCTVLHGIDKALFAHPRAFLIDDNKRNCDAFIAHGGRAYQYEALNDPRPEKMLQAIDEWISEHDERRTGTEYLSLSRA